MDWIRKEVRGFGMASINFDRRSAQALLQAKSKSSKIPLILSDRFFRRA
jgi:hypothetical protein